MKTSIRLGDIVAFAIGAAVACVWAASWNNPTSPATMVVMFLCPGWLVALPTLGLLQIGLFTSGFFVFLLMTTAVVNGLIYGLVWHVTRLAFSGGWPLLIPVVVAAGFWVLWFAHWVAENRPRPEPPLAPVDLTSPLAGRWEGVIHGERGEVPVTVILHPRTDGTLDGFQCVGREPEYIERFDEGTHAGGDSLYYVIISFEQRGRRDSTSMTIESSVGGSKQTWDLRFATADTGRAGLPTQVE